MRLAKDVSHADPFRSRGKPPRHPLAHGKGDDLSGNFGADGLGWGFVRDDIWVVALLSLVAFARRRLSSTGIGADVHWRLAHGFGNNSCHKCSAYLAGGAP